MNLKHYQGAAIEPNKVSFCYSVNNSKLKNEQIYERQLKLVVKRLGTRIGIEESNVTIELGRNAEDFLSSKHTLILTFRIEASTIN